MGHMLLKRRVVLAPFILWMLCAGVVAASAQEQTTAASNRTAAEELAELQRKVQKLDAEVTRLRALVAKLEKYQQIDYLRDQLMKEEQRTEALQTQLLELEVKEEPLQARMDEIDALLRPQNLEQAMAGVGSTRPEEARDFARIRLGNEKRRLQNQLELLKQSRMRLQAALNTADASVQRLKQRLSEATRPQ